MADKTHSRLSRDLKRAADHKRLCDAITQFLRENGPTEFKKLVMAMQTTTGRLSQAGRTLQDGSVIHRYQAYPGHDSTRMWSLEPRPPVEPKPRNEARKPNIGMDPEHLAWMEKYRRRAELRRQGVQPWAMS